jgi:hypothetical protein
MLPVAVPATPRERLGVSCGSEFEETEFHREEETFGFPEIHSVARMDLLPQQRLAVVTHIQGESGFIAELDAARRVP